MGALTAGLEQLGQEVPATSNLMLDIKDGAVHVTDIQFQRVFEIKRISDQIHDGDGDNDEAAVPQAQSARSSSPPNDAPETTDDEPETADDEPETADDEPETADDVSEPARETVVVPARGEIISHAVFFSRDDEPSDENPLCYRERLFAVEPGTTREQAEALLRDYYKSIKLELKKRPRGKYINLAVFDHQFEDRAERPAIAALDWKDWTRRPKISFPLESPSVVATSHIPTATADEAETQKQQELRERQEKARVEEEREKKERQEKAREEEEREKKERQEKARVEEEREKKKREQKKRKAREQKQRKKREKNKVEHPAAVDRAGDQGIGRKAVAIDLNEVLVEVFEAMQELYFIKTRPECIKFAVDLIADKIPCDSVVGLAKIPSAPDRMECVTIRGEDAKHLAGQTIALSATLLDLSVREGLAIAVSDVQNDERLTIDAEHIIDGQTQSALCVPFTFEGRTFGAAELINRHNGSSWQQGEVHIVSYIANHLSEYIAQSLPSDEDFSSLFEQPSTKSAKPQPGTKQRPKSSSPKKRGR